MTGLYPLVAALALAHLVADYPLQTDWMAENKHDRRDALLIHSLVHSAVAVVAVYPLLGFVDSATVAVLVPLYHGLTDSKQLGIRADQTTHLVWCVVTAVIVLFPFQ